MRFIIFVLLWLAPGMALAQSSPPPLTAEESVALAVKHNPRLSAAVRDVVAARSGVRSAGAPANPQIAFTPGLTSLSGTDEELLISQPLELNGTRAARTGVADARLQQINAASVVELRSVVFATKRAYYNLARTREQLALSRDLLAITEEVARLTRRQVELGSRPGIDQTQTEIEVSRARQQVATDEGESDAVQAALNTLMGRRALTPVGTLAPLTVAPTSVEHDTVVRQALAARAEIAGELAGAEAFRQEARLARAEGRPDLAPQFRAGSVTRRFSDYGIGLAITLPIFDYGSRRDRIRQAEESARAQADRVTAARNLVEQEVEQALARLRATERTLKEYDEGLLDKTRRLLDASRTGFQVGQTSVLALLEAQRTYRTVQSERINALVASMLARAELEYAMGAVAPDLLPAVATERRKTK